MSVSMFKLTGVTYLSFRTSTWTAIKLLRSTEYVRSRYQAQPNHRSELTTRNFDEPCQVCSDRPAGNIALIIRWQETTEGDPGAT